MKSTYLGKRMTSKKKKKPELVWKKWSMKKHMQATDLVSICWFVPTKTREERHKLLSPCELPSHEDINSNDSVFFRNIYKGTWSAFLGDMRVY